MPYFIKASAIVTLIATYKAADACSEGGYWFIFESSKASSSKYWAKKNTIESAFAILLYLSRNLYDDVSVIWNSSENSIYISSARIYDLV